jgi:hypothetical protein
MYPMGHATIFSHGMPQILWMAACLLAKVIFFSLPAFGSLNLLSFPL